MEETTQEILNRLAKAIIDSYNLQLSGLPFKKGRREALQDGYAAGVREGIRQTVAMMEIKVKG